MTLTELYSKFSCMTQSITSKNVIKQDAVNGPQQLEQIPMKVLEAFPAGGTTLPSPEPRVSALCWMGLLGFDRSRRHFMPQKEVAKGIRF